jgi:hypothetical protein
MIGNIKIIKIISYSLQTIKRAFTTCLKSIDCMNQKGRGTYSSLDDKIHNKILLLENKSETSKEKIKYL